MPLGLSFMSMEVFDNANLLTVSTLLTVQLSVFSPEPSLKPPSLNIFATVSLVSSLPTALPATVTNS